MHDIQDLPKNKEQEYKSDLGYTKVEIVKLPGFVLKSGESLQDFDLAYLTLGTLSEKKDNVILICHALSGTAHVAGLDKETGKPGWWDFHVGPGKSIDTDHFFVIASNVIGGCNGSFGPSSDSPNVELENEVKISNKKMGMSFPSISIEDMVRAQVALLEYLEIKTLFAVVGGSLGGMQALVWATKYCDRVKHCIPIATCMAHSAMQIAFNEIGRQAIINDPNWQEGNYYGKQRPEQGLAVARMVGHVTYLSEYSMRQKFGRQIQKQNSNTNPFKFFFSVESYLQYQGESFVKRFDPNSYLYITKALDMFDLLEGKHANEVFEKVKARFLVISFESDWLYPTSQSKELVKALKRANCKVSYINLDTQYGHDSFLIQNEKFTNLLRNYLLSSKNI